MVYVTYDWIAFKEYAVHCRTGTFQKKLTEEGTEVRVRCGRLGFVKVFADLKDPEQLTQYNELIRFCTARGFVEIEFSIQDELFHA